MLGVIELVWGLVSRDRSSHIGLGVSAVVIGALTWIGRDVQVGETSWLIRHRLIAGQVLFVGMAAGFAVFAAVAHRRRQYGWVVFDSLGVTVCLCGWLYFVIVVRRQLKASAPPKNRNIVA